MADFGGDEWRGSLGRVAAPVDQYDRRNKGDHRHWSANARAEAHIPQRVAAFFGGNACALETIREELKSVC